MQRKTRDLIPTKQLLLPSITFHAPSFTGVYLILGVLIQSKNGVCEFEVFVLPIVVIDLQRKKNSIVFRQWPFHLFLWKHIWLKILLKAHRSTWSQKRLTADLCMGASIFRLQYMYGVGWGHGVVMSECESFAPLLLVKESQKCSTHCGQLFPGSGVGQRYRGLRAVLVVLGRRPGNDTGNMWTHQMKRRNNIAFWFWEFLNIYRPTTNPVAIYPVCVWFRWHSHMYSHWQTGSHSLWLYKWTAESLRYEPKFQESRFPVLPDNRISSWPCCECSFWKKETRDFQGLMFSLENVEIGSHLFPAKNETTFGESVIRKNWTNFFNEEMRECTCTMPRKRCVVL